MPPQNCGGTEPALEGPRYTRRTPAQPSTASICPHHPIPSLAHPRGTTSPVGERQTSSPRHHRKPPQLSLPPPVLEPPPTSYTPAPQLPPTSRLSASDIATTVCSQRDPAHGGGPCGHRFPPQVKGAQKTHWPSSMATLTAPAAPMDACRPSGHPAQRTPLLRDGAGCAPPTRAGSATPPLAAPAALTCGTATPPIPPR